MREPLRLGLGLLLLWSQAAVGWAKEAPKRYPNATWQRVDRPEDRGWSSAKLAEAKAYADRSLDTAAVMVVLDGAILYEWGATDKKFNVHSIRKSFLSALYGVQVKRGKIDLEKTLGQLGIDDIEPKLTAEEKQATIGDLLKARSGVYHNANYETATMRARRPRRGSHLPGTFWYYNNWDFNALGTIYEQETGSKIFRDFDRYFARPLQMQDFDLADTKYHHEEFSEHPAYIFRMTARDMARFGLLYLRRGWWRNQQIITENWVKESSTSHSKSHRGGYGYLWWTCLEGVHFKGVALEDSAYSARGYHGHYIVVIPQHDLVVVHRVNTDDETQAVSSNQFGGLLRRILEAKQGS